MQFIFIVHFLHRSGRTLRVISICLQKTHSYACHIWDMLGFVSHISDLVCFTILSIFLCLGNRKNIHYFYFYSKIFLFCFELEQPGRGRHSDGATSYPNIQFCKIKIFCRNLSSSCSSVIFGREIM